MNVCVCVCVYIYTHTYSYGHTRNYTHVQVYLSAPENREAYSVTLTKGNLEMNVTFTCLKKWMIKVIHYRKGQLMFCQSVSILIELTLLHTHCCPGTYLNSLAISKIGYYKSIPLFFLLKINSIVK